MTKRNQKPTYQQVDRLVILAMEPIYFCPIMEEEIPGPKANFQAHLREEHTAQELELFLHTWDPDYQPPNGLDWQCEVSGALIKIRLPGAAIMAKIRQHRAAVPDYPNFVTIKNSITVRLEQVMSDLLADPEWLPLTDASETRGGKVNEPSGNNIGKGTKPGG